MDFTNTIADLTDKIHMPFLGKASHMRTSCFKRWCFQTYIQVLEIMVSSGEDLDEFYDLTCVHILFRKA